MKYKFTSNVTVEASSAEDALNIITAYISRDIRLGKFDGSEGVYALAEVSKGDPVDLSLPAPKSEPTVEE